MADVMKFVLKHYSQVKSCLPSYNLEHIFTTSETEDLQPRGLQRGLDHGLLPSWR